MQKNMNKNKRKFNVSAESLDLIAVHIPKTAGTTFCNFLLDIYGHEHVLERYGKSQLAVERIKSISDEQIQNILDSKPEIRAITGHFNSDKYLKIYPSTKMIIWLRDPIKRLISHYYYWQTRKPTNLLHKTVLDNKLSLLEFARLNEIRNFMSMFVGDHSLEKFFFVGIQEYFDEDLKNLNLKMNWKVQNISPTKMINSYPEYKILVKETLGNDLLMSELNSINSQDIQLYKQALELRETRINSIAESMI